MGDLIFFAAIAAFVCWRLYTVLGKKVDIDRRDDSKDSKSKRVMGSLIQPIGIDESVKSQPKKKEPKAKSAKTANEQKLPKQVAEALEKVVSIDSGFEVAKFISGAKMAFEMIFDSVKDNDRDTLKMLLSDDMYKEFEQNLDARIANKDEIQETTLVAVKSANLESISLSGSVALINVEFSSEQISVVKNKDGAIIEGDPSQIDIVEETWSFERDLKSSNPNWKIVEIA